MCSLSQVHLRVQLLSDLENLAAGHLPWAILAMFGLLMIRAFSSLIP